MEDDLMLAWREVNRLWQALLKERKKNGVLQHDLLNEEKRVEQLSLLLIDMGVEIPPYPKD